MKFTVSWLKDHLDTQASVAEIAERLTMLGLRGGGRGGPRARPRALRRRLRGRGVQASRTPTGCALHRRHRQGHRAGRVRRAQRAHRHEGRVRAARHAHPAAPATCSRRAHPRRGFATACCARSARWACRDEHAGIIELPEDAPMGAPVAQVMGFGDPVIDVAITPNRGDCARRARHRARSRGGRHRHAEAARHRAGAGRVREPDQVAARSRRRTRAMPAPTSPGAISAT